MMSFER